MIHIGELFNIFYYMCFETKPDVEKFSSDNTNEGQKKNEEKSGRCSASFDPLKSENGKDKERESKETFYDANDRLPTGRYTTEMLSQEQCTHIKQYLLLPPI